MGHWLSIAAGYIELLVGHWLSIAAGYIELLVGHWLSIAAGYIAVQLVHHLLSMTDYFLSYFSLEKEYTLQTCVPRVPTTALHLNPEMKHLPCSVM